MELNFIFSESERRNWKFKLDKCLPFLEQNLLSQNGDFQISLAPFKSKKSWEQLKAIYKLFELSLPYFQEWKPHIAWDLDLIKEFSKSELGYTREPTSFEIAMMIKQSGFIPKSQEEKKRMIKFCKKMKQNKSFADFTKEELYNFTNEYEAWAITASKEKPSWPNIFLEKQN